MELLSSWAAAGREVGLGSCAKDSLFLLRFYWFSWKNVSSFAEPSWDNFQRLYFILFLLLYLPVMVVLLGNYPWGSSHTVFESGLYGLSFLDKQHAFFRFRDTSSLMKISVYLFRLCRAPVVALGTCSLCWASRIFSCGMWTPGYIMWYFWFLFLTVPHGTWDLSSLTTDWTWASCIRNVES